ncbi:MAG: alpha/beta hydrolase family protein [Candidatus Hodarchaeota archaeon]
MDFKEKQFDEPYEVAEIEIHNEGQIFRGIQYFPPKNFKRPYPVIIYFHGFPQLFTLKEIVNDHQFLLEMGYCFISINFRGYRFSEGEISIRSQLSDSKRIIKFVELMAKKGIFKIEDINIIAHDFGAYIAIILCSQIDLINKLVLKSPIMDLNKHVNNNDFKKVLNYINRFLPGNIRGIENVNDFIQMTKKELKRQEFQIEKAISKLNLKELKIIIGKEDKVTPLHELNSIIQKAKVKPSVLVIDGMDHDIFEDGKIELINSELKEFFRIT